MPKVSVIIASYNHQKYVREAIESVLKQTLQDFEIIITDDASTDATVREIKKIKDRRITLFRFKKGQGQFAATNSSIKKAQGEFISILNSDDIYFPRKLAKQVDFMEKNPRIAAVFSHAQLIDEQSEPFTDKKHFYYKAFNCDLTL